jgi:hypothetical protein
VRVYPHRAVRHSANLPFTMLSQYSLPLAIQPFPNSHAQRSPAPPHHRTLPSHRINSGTMSSAGSRHSFSLCVGASALEQHQVYTFSQRPTARLCGDVRLHLVAAVLAAVLRQRRADLALERVGANDVVDPPGVTVELAESHVLRAGRVLW